MYAQHYNSTQHESPVLSRSCRAMQNCPGHAELLRSCCMIQFMHNYSRSSCDCLGSLAAPLMPMHCKCPHNLEPSTALIQWLGACRVILEAMSPEAESVLAQHNQEAVDNLVAYISNYVSAHIDSLPPANVLPLSGFAYPLTSTAASKSASDLKQQPSAACGGSVHAIGHSSSMSEGGGALRDFRKECRISSPFAALSGRHVEPPLFIFQFACFQMLSGSACALHAQECSAHVWLMCRKCKRLGFSNLAELICWLPHSCCAWHPTAREAAPSCCRS